MGDIREEEFKRFIDVFKEFLISASKAQSR